jgi:glutamine synthetase
MSSARVAETHDVERTREADGPHVPGGRSLTAEDVLATCRERNVRFLRLQFTDIMGIIKNVEVPAQQFQKALNGEILFDGSSIEGFARIEESDMLLHPDPSTFAIYPAWESNGHGTVARLICDVHLPDGRPFAGCPRLALKRVMAEARSLGYEPVAGPEAEFFLFQRNPDGEATTVTHDAGGYFDLAPVDRGEDARRAIVNDLEAMGFEVEAAHHEVAPGQHEIDFKYADMVTTADNLSTFRFIVRRRALEFGLHATFMPKPLFGENGSGMHVHQSLFKDHKNAFHDPKKPWELDDVALWYIGGLLRHAKGMVAITNPLINSYKRLVPGYEAPTHITWSERNRSPMARVPDRRGTGTRVELRMPDPSANPYLALTVMLKAGLDGIHHRIDPGPPVNKNIYTMSHRERRRLKIDSLPEDLNQALQQLEKDKVIQEALGEHITRHFIEAKRKVWKEYIAQVHPWELDRYLAAY